MKKVNILGTDYSIKHTNLFDENIDGYCDYTAKEIVIRSDNVNKVKNFDWLVKKQLRHEIIHAFMSESGLQANWEHTHQYGHEETTVDWIAIQFPKMMKAFKEADCL